MTFGEFVKKKAKGKKKRKINEREMTEIMGNVLENLNSTLNEHYTSREKM